MGYCFFYDEMWVIDISVVLEVFVKVNEFGMVIFFNIFFGFFI